MADISVHLDTAQVRALGAKLEAVGGAVGAVAAAAVRKTAADIERDAKGTAPFDTGALRGSISTTVTGDGRFAGISAEVGPTVEYGIYQELGTSRMPANPYLVPAFDRHAPQLEKALAKIVEATGL